MEEKIQVVDFEKVIYLIDKNFAELRQGVDLDSMSDASIINFISGLDKLEVQAWRIKLRLEMNELVSKEPDISLRNALIKVLEKLPESISPKAMSVLVLSAKENWEELTSKSLA